MSEQDTGLLLAALIIIVVWCGIAAFVVTAGRRRPQPEDKPRPSNTSTPLGAAVWKAHVAAQELDAAIAVGGSEEVIAAARQALSAAANLSVLLRARELQGTKPENVWDA